MKIKGMISLLQNILFIKDKEFGSILRRFFINTLFDSTFMQIGIIVGSAFAADQDLHLIIRTLIASSIALGISTGISTYESEKLERMIKIAELEKAMFRKLDETIISERDRTSTLIISTINFLTPLLCCSIIIIPLLFSLHQFLNITIASWISVGLALSILFLAGAYLGKLSKGDPFIKGLRMVVFGGVAFIIGFFIQRLF
jgi:predicted membrane protein (TIGR00267 family)